jgi:hypothetical protein
VLEQVTEVILFQSSFLCCKGELVGITFLHVLCKVFKGCDVEIIGNIHAGSLSSCFILPG